MALDPYFTLGVDRDADDATIKKAYKVAAQRAHPDRNPDDPHAETRFKLIGEAYAILSDPERRAKYDRGEGTEKMPDPRERAMGMMAGALIEVLKQSDECGALSDPRFSVVDSLREALTQMQREAQARKRGAEQVSTALSAQLKRVKYKGAERNVIADILTGQIAKAKAQFTTHARDLTDVTAALELLKQYEGLPPEDLFSGMQDLRGRLLSQITTRREGDDEVYRWQVT